MLYQCLKRQLTLRISNFKDLPKIIELLQQDTLGKQRESLSKDALSQYEKAFKDIECSNGHEVWVLENQQGIIGTLQFSVLPNLTYQGLPRAQIEGVRIAHSCRGMGLGNWLLEKVIEEAKVRKCHLVQLSCNKSRYDSIKFYEHLGFKSSHEGFKYFIS